MAWLVEVVERYDARERARFEQQLQQRRPPAPRLVRGRHDDDQDVAA
jgi:hypothetical protein